jgi:hypothetical protein
MQERELTSTINHYERLKSENYVIRSFLREDTKNVNTMEQFSCMVMDKVRRKDIGMKRRNSHKKSPFCLGFTYFNF